MYPNPNSQFYLQDLQNMRDRIDRQLNQIQQMQNPQYSQTPQINQTFQLSPNQNNSGVKYASSINDVKKELVFGDTVFLDKNFTQMWFKNASGEIKTYELREIIELDEKDLKIKELEHKIDMLERDTKNARNVDENVIEPITGTKPTNVSSNSTSKAK